MVQFYNRKPWNLIIGLGGLLTFFVLFAALTTFWILPLPFLIVAFLYLKIWIARKIQLRTKGYFSGRRQGDKWIYEERQGETILSLSLDVENTEPGHYELFIPSEKQWRSFAPAWAQNRREEISRRIEKSWSSADFHLPEDFEHA